MAQEFSYGGQAVVEGVLTHCSSSLVWSVTRGLLVMVSALRMATADVLPVHQPCCCPLGHYIRKGSAHQSLSWAYTKESDGGNPTSHVILDHGVPVTDAHSGRCAGRGPGPEHQPEDLLSRSFRLAGTGALLVAEAAESATLLCYGPRVSTVSGRA